VQSVVDGSPTRGRRTHAWVWTVGLPVAAGVAALILALMSLGARDLELDEAYSVTSTNQLSASLQQRSGSMALYYVMLAPLANLSVDPFWIRLPSALFAGIAVGLTVHLASTYFGRRTALWTATLLVPMWGVTRFAQEARSYSLVMALSVVSWLLFLRLMAKESTVGWVAWGICAASLTYSHPLASFVVASQVIVSWSTHPQPRLLLRRAVPGVLTAGVLLLPMFITFGQETGAAPDWIRPLGAHSANEMASIVVGPHTALQLLVGVVLIGATVRALRIASRDQTFGVDSTGWLLKCMTVWLWLTPVVLVLISLATPMIRERYLIGSLPAMAIVLAATLSTIPEAQLRRGVGLAAVALLLPGQISIHTEEGYPWSEAVDIIESDLNADTRHGVLFIATGSRHPFELAAAGSRVLDESKPIRPAERWGTNLRYFEEVPWQTIEARAQEVDVIWLPEQYVPLGRSQEPPPHWSQVEPLERIGFCVDRVHRLHPEVDLTRFVRCSQRTQ
jgi:hypothetical protein